VQSKLTGKLLVTPQAKVMVTEKVKATGTVKELLAKVWQLAERWLSFRLLLKLPVSGSSTLSTARQ